MEQDLHTCYSEPSSCSSSSSSSEEDYINMEVDLYSSFDSSSIFTAKEFEFQSFSSSSDRDHTTTSPADDLFCMGKLLPLHLPPRLQMVHNILHNSASFQAKKDHNFEDESFSTPLFTPASNTPFESCNISPAESREVSRELNPNEHFVEHFAGVQEKRSWTKKLKMIKHSSGIGSKLKWTNLKYLFTKSSGCSDEYSAVADHTQVSKVKQYVDSHWNAAPFGEIRCNKGEAVEGQRGGGHRRSFSGAFKRLSKAKTAASGSVSGVENLNRNALKKSVRSSAESESPIQAAIAHCKRSQNSRQIVDETAFCAISGSTRVLYDYNF